MATGLESQLIEGAYRAALKDPKGDIARAQRYTSRQITGAVTGIAKKHAAKKKEKEDELKGYDDRWETIQTEVIDNQGLGMTGHGQATDLAEEEKVIHDACPPGQEGNRCRRDSIMRLKNMAGKYSAQKEYLEGLVSRQKKMSGTDPDGKELDLSKGQSEDAKKILAGLSDRNSAHRMKNDDEIASIKEQLKNAKPEEKKALKKQIEELKKSNERVVGWDVPGTDKYGKEFGFMTAEDLEKANLLPVAASDVKLEFGNQTKEALEIAEKLRTGAKEGKKYDVDKQAAIYGESITSVNMKSIFKDPLYGGTETIEDHLREHPVFTGMTYSGLGIKAVGKDDIIDPEEWAAIDKLNPEDLDKVINEISNDEDLAKLVGGNYMALKTDRAVNTELYGDEYYPEPSGPISEVTGHPTYTDKDRTLNFGFDENGVYKEGPTVYPTIQALREAIEIDKTTIRGDWENETTLKKRGYIHGMAQSGTTYIKTGRGVVAQKLAAPGDMSIYNE